MRHDLNKLLCERERHRSESKFHENRRMKDFDEMLNYDEQDIDPIVSTDGGDDDRPVNSISGGHREGMRRRYKVKGNPKSFNENLNPLFGFVQARVGKNWDKVYSEICSVFDKRSVINNHILEHLFQYVEIKTEVNEDGKLCTRSYGGRLEPIRDHSFCEFYVDCRDGILKKNNWRESYRQRRRRQAAEYQAKQLLVKRKIDDMTELECIDGLWYKIEYDYRDAVYYKPEGAKYGTEHYFVGDKRQAEYPAFHTLVRTERVCSAKKALSHKELKQYNLI